MSSCLRTFVEHGLLTFLLLLPSTTSDVIQSASFVRFVLCDCRSVSYRITPILLDRVDFEERFYSADSSWAKECTANF